MYSRIWRMAATTGARTRSKRLGLYPQFESAKEALDRLERGTTGFASTSHEEGDRMSKRILAASPVHQKSAILKLFLESLAGLERNGLEVDYLFFDDNEEEASRRLLEEFAERQDGVTIVKEQQVHAYIKDESTHYWNDTLVDKVASMKDRIIEHALERGYDALFLIDSDLLVHPDTLLRLDGTGKSIVSNIFWTRWQPNTSELPQVWMMDEYSFVRQSHRKALTDEEANRKAAQFLELMRTPGVYEVGGLGACTLIRKEALEKGVRFRRLPNVSFWGEDRHFCIRAAALGIGLYVDTRKPAYHIYRDSDIEGAIRFKRSIEKGDTPGIGISLCMIVKDEERSLERCLKSVQGIADEIVVVDTGSTDRTKEIALQFQAKVYDFAWIDDFSAARNYAFSQATEPYILWLDADDVLEQPDREKFIALKHELDPKVDSVMMDYHLMFDSAGEPTVSLKRNRLVKRSCGFRWIGVVHEYLEVAGHVIHSDIAVTHRKDKTYTDRNLRIYRQKAEQGETFSPRDQYYYANELRDHSYVEEAVVQYEIFLKTKQGWVEDRIAACLKMADCYGRMYERDNQLQALFRSMEYDLPRAECCCRLGALFMAENRLQQAIYWYETAASLGEPPRSGALIDHAAWTWLPLLQLCVLYDKLGQTDKAYECNERALRFRPDHPSMLYNKKYFQEKLAKQEERRP